MICPVLCPGSTLLRLVKIAVSFLLVPLVVKLLHFAFAVTMVLNTDLLLDRHRVQYYEIYFVK